MVDECQPGESGDPSTLTPSSSIEDVLWAHRQSSALMPRAVLSSRLRQFYGQPLNRIPYDLIRQFMRHSTDGTIRLQSALSDPDTVGLMSSIPRARRWY
jgi:hypothetical protein